MKRFCPLGFLIFAVVAIVPAMAAQTSDPATTQTASRPKASFYDSWITGRLKAEKLDTSATALLRQARELETSRGEGITSQTRAAELYGQFLARYPKSAYSLVVRLNLIRQLSALYSYRDDTVFRDKEFEVAREGLRQVDELAAQHPESEFLEWLRGEYLSPLMSLGGSAAPETIDRVHKFYLKALEDRNLADSARIMILYRLIDMALNQRNYEEARRYVSQGEELAGRMSKSADEANKATGTTGRTSFAFLAAKTAILKGDKNAEREALDRLKAVTPEARRKKIAQALDLIRKRATEAKSPAR